MLHKKLSTLRNLLELRVPRLTISLTYENSLDIIHYLHINHVHTSGFIASNRDFTWIGSKEGLQDVEKGIETLLKPRKGRVFSGEYTVYRRLGSADIHYMHLQSIEFRRQHTAIFRYKVNAEDIYRDLTDLTKEKTVDAF